MAEIKIVYSGGQGPAGQGVPTGGTAGQFLQKIDGTDYNTQWTTSAATVTTIKDIGDVYSSMSPTDGQVLTYDTTNGWQAENPTGGGTWGSITGTLSSQTDLQSALDAKAASSHTHATTDITSGTFADARIAASNVTQHQAALSITESQISDLGSYLTDITGETLDSLSNVTITANSAGEILKWSGSAWVNNTLAEAGIATSAQGALADTATQPGDNISTLTNDSGFITTFDIVNDTTPQLGGNLDVQANSITTSTTNGSIVLTPNGVGNVQLGNFVFDGDQTVGAGQDDYVLTYDHASGRIALEAAGAGSGEANTASNVGTAGVGVYKTKVGADLQFKKINAGSSKVTITDDTGNDEIDIDIVEANITITESQISDLGSYLTSISGESLSTLSDVTITANSAGEILKWDGAAWINNTLAEAGIAAASHTHATSDITSGTFADARIAASNVTQHQAALSITESQISDLGAYITALSEDTTPELSGTLTTNGNTIDGGAGAGTFTITKAGSGNLVLTQSGAGSIVLDGLTWPSADGTNGQVLQTNGTGTLSFVTVSKPGDNLSTFTNDSGFLTTESNDLTSAVTWANVPDANITQSSVTQHQAALSITESQISDLGTYQTVSTATVQTTDATSTTLVDIAIPTDQEKLVSIKVHGHEDATDDHIWKKMEIGAKNIAGTVSIVGGVDSATGYDAGATAWTITAAASTSNIRITVTGEAAHTIDWRAQIQID